MASLNNIAWQRNVTLNNVIIINSHRISVNINERIIATRRKTARQ